MKKVLVALITVVLPMSTFANFDLDRANDLEPYCGLNGVTITKDNYFSYVSDTSSRSIPQAYEGECRDYPELSATEKKRIHTVIYKALGQYLGEGSERDEKWHTITNDFVQMKLFGMLEKLIGNEHVKGKEKADLEKMAKISYIVSLFGYDYFLEKPSK